MTINYNESDAIAIRSFLISKGLNEYAIAGLLANIYTESGLRSDNLQNSFVKKLGLSDEEYTIAVDCGAYGNFVCDSAGYGLCQWTSSGRKQRLLDFVKARGKSIGDRETQLDFMWWELSNGYKTVLDGLKIAKSVDEATRLIMLKFERPADQSEARQLGRVEYGLEFYKRYAKEVNTMTKVAIDAGHGSQTAGKRTPDGYREHWINVKTAFYCEQYLLKNGIEVIRIAWNDLNATDDIDVSLSQRQKLIKNANCLVSVSCHANAYGDGKSFNSATGVSTHIHNDGSKVGDSLKLAQLVQAELVKGTKQKNRGVVRQSLAMCNCPAMNTKTSILCEIAFMTNKAEADLMKTEAFCKEQGEDIAKGVIAYLNSLKNVPTNGGELKVKTKTQMNVRAGAGTSYKIKSVAPIGIYTIVEVKGSWGKLKSGAGWINISDKYATKL